MSRECVGNEVERRGGSNRRIGQKGYDEEQHVSETVGIENEVKWWCVRFIRSST